MSLKLYNTQTRQKSPFVPQEPGKASIYLCGPTVYDILHIGNFRGAIFFNLLRNWLEKSGLKVTMVYNYTDIDDKIIKKAQAESVESAVISERYIKEFEKDFSRLGLRKHDHNPRVTEFLPQIISFIEDLIKNNKAYVVEGEVFYDTQAFEGYGKLSGKKLDDLVAGQRVEVDQRKKNPADFVLWKPSKQNEPSWPSPWSPGRPGWHIECSAMIQTLIGETVDIHGGGIDLIFPHHENELAQGEGRTGKAYCNHWVHNEFVNLKGEKMSKSLGNVITGRSFMDRYHPEILKYLYLSVHYRTRFDISEEKIFGVMAALHRVYQALFVAQQVLESSCQEASSQELQAQAQNSKCQQFYSSLTQKQSQALDDDLNTGEAMAALFDGIRYFNGLNLLKKLKNPTSQAQAYAFKNWVTSFGSLMALFEQPPEQFLDQLTDIALREKEVSKEQVEQLVEQRIKARAEKNWQQADEIRDQLDQMGIALVDGSRRGWEVKF